MALMIFCSWFLFRRIQVSCRLCLITNWFYGLWVLDSCCVLNGIPGPLCSNYHLSYNNHKSSYDPCMSKKPTLSCAPRRRHVLTWVWIISVHNIRVVVFFSFCNSYFYFDFWPKMFNLNLGCIKTFSCFQFPFDQPALD